MAGHRRTGGVAKPRRAASRYQRRRAELAADYGKAGTPAQRLGVAYAYALGALARSGPTQTEAGRRADELADLLIEFADRLLQRQANNATRRVV